MEQGADNSTEGRPTGAKPAVGNGVARAARMELALQLRGALPCLRCGYNLGGLSIRGVCPECGTPIRATLLVVVDPHARELRPLPRPRLMVAGLLAWSLGALMAALLGWWMTLAPLVEAWGWGPWAIGWAREAAMWSLVVSAGGALALVRPHGGVPRSQVIAAAAGVAGTVALALCSHWLWVRWPPGSAPARISGAVPPIDATVFRLVEALLLALVIVCLRANARMLEARSLLLRSGRVERQTMFAMAAAAAMVAAGHAVVLGAGLLSGGAREVAISAGTIVVAVGWMLVTIGLVGVVLDVVRLCPVLLEPSPSLKSLLVGRGGAGG